MNSERAKPRTRLGLLLLEAVWAAGMLWCGYRVGHYVATMEAVEIVRQITAVHQPASTEFYGVRADTAAHTRVCCKISRTGLLLMAEDR